ncbi:2-dehydro-3-deoxygalactonokinase [Neomegalonema perideroedes]|uniref:2-dehydro-3-deoxygalactonokinase n=1 Tax=Neomegalonema perideroedes TaxID=217219 RepID=UPI000364BE47|nr:2-dehydro-3-deoxygalactonokinase [Neomegalonema perideroedes]
MNVSPEWIAVDWGSSNLRAFAMRGGEPLAESASGEGASGLAREDFEPALLRVIGPWLTEGRVTPVLACGMVGARHGWIEAPYRAVPCAPVAPGETILAPTQDPRLSLRITPGLSQASPADVMRGEETQIAGFLAGEPAFAGALILPGTHSKQARIADGKVLSFSTWMTGELFALLSQGSVLRHSLQSGEGEDLAAFVEGVGIGAEGRALRGLFALRAEGLLEGLPAQAARSRLSGMLIGAELAGFDPGGDCVVIGAGGLARAYLAALRSLGLAARACDGAELARRGLALIQEGKNL